MINFFAKLDPRAERTIKSLNDRPEEWSSDRYYLAHPSGVRVWIANEAYALRLEVRSSAPGIVSIYDRDDHTLDKYSKTRMWLAYLDWAKNPKRLGDVIEALDSYEKALADQAGVAS